MQADPLTRKDREKQMRQQEILQAARQIFLQKGYHEATLEEIARQAEFGKGTIYNYFSSKEDLLFALVDQMMDNFHLLAQTAMDHEGETVRQLYTRFAHAVIAHARENSALIHFLMREMKRLSLDHRENQKLSFKTRVRQIWQILAKPLEKEQQAGLIKDMDPLFLASMFDGMLRFFCMNHFGPLQFPRHLDADQAVQTLITLFFEGIIKIND